MSIFDIFKKKKNLIEPIKTRYPVMCIEHSVYPDEENLLERIVRQGIKYEQIEPYDGMTNKDIKEMDERVYQVNNEYADCRLELNEGVVKVYITDYDEKEYFVTDIKLNKKFQFYFDNKDKLDVKEDFYFRGGKYKQVYDGHVETDESPLCIYIDIAMFEKEL